jgi:hypothetical protein
MILSCLHVMMALIAFSFASSRTVTLFNDGWLFHLGDDLEWNCSTPSSSLVFPIDLTDIQIVPSYQDALARTPAGDASAEDCARTCGCGCQVWQYCNNSRCAAASATAAEVQRAAAAPTCPNGS